MSLRASIAALVAALSRPTGTRFALAIGVRTAVALGVANVNGAIVVFLYLIYVLPTAPGAPIGVLANVYVFVAYLIASVVAGSVWALRGSRPVYRWLAAGRPPTPYERRRALRMPMHNVVISATMWFGAVIVFTVLNTQYSTRAAVGVGGTIALGGLTTCAVCFLLAERIARPMFARALVDHQPDRPATLGVSARVVLTWALSTGIPLLGIGLAFAGRPAGSAGDLVAPTYFLVAVGLVVGLFSMAIAARSIAEPLDAVRAALVEVERGHLDIAVPVDDGGEIGLLQSGVNRMVAGLRERRALRELFGRQVGEDVARQALERGVGLGGETLDVAALFVDLVGSTRLAAERPAAEVVDVLNGVFGIVVEVTARHGGFVNKFEGDAALCVFGAPVAREDAASAALTAARELRDRLVALPGVDAGIGVSAGPVVAGNVGAEARYEYTIIGDPVNEAARLTELAKQRPERLLASEVVLCRVTDDEAAHWHLDDEVVLRGRLTPTRLAVPLLTCSL